MSSRLSPFDTASLCSWPSLSMMVTQSSSPGLGGSTWPCRVDGVEEKDRTVAEGVGRIGRGEGRRFGEVAKALFIVVGPVFVLPNRRRLGGEGLDVEEGRRRAKARVNVRGVAIAVRDYLGSMCRGRERERRRRRKRREEGWWGLASRLISSEKERWNSLFCLANGNSSGLKAANARMCV